MIKGKKFARSLIIILIYSIKSFIQKYKYKFLNLLDIVNPICIFLPTNNIHDPYLF